MGIENPLHLIFLGAVALIVLGPKKLPELARTLGKGIREFRDAMAGMSAGESHEELPPQDDSSHPPAAEEQPPEG